MYVFMLDKSPAHHIDKTLGDKLKNETENEV